MSRFFLFAFLFFGFSLYGMDDARLKKMAVKKFIISKKRKSRSNLSKKKRSNKRRSRRNTIRPKTPGEKTSGSDELLKKRRRIRRLGQMKTRRRKRTITTFPGENSRRISVRKAPKKIKKEEERLKQKIESATPPNEKRQEFIEDELGQQKARHVTLAAGRTRVFLGNERLSRRQIRGLSILELFRSPCQSDS